MNRENQEVVITIVASLSKEQLEALFDEIETDIEWLANCVAGRLSELA